MKRILAKYKTLHSLIILILRIFLSVLFVAASLPKLWHPHDFALAIFRYQIIPYNMVNLIAVFLPWLELTTSVALLIWTKSRKAALIILLLMLVSFTAAISSALIRGIDIACGCFSVNPAAAHIGLLSIGQNIFLIIIAVVLLKNEEWYRSRI